MSLADRDAGACGADYKVGVNELSGLQAAHDFERFNLDFIFFPTNIRKDIINNIQRRDARIPGPAERLEAGDHYFFEAKSVLQRFKGQHKMDSGAIWVGDDKAAILSSPGSFAEFL